MKEVSDNHKRFADILRSISTSAGEIVKNELQRLAHESKQNGLRH